MEDKATICDVFGSCLRLTRAGHDLSYISYQKIGDDEFAILSYDDGTTRNICITADSGIAIMRDILKHM